MQRKILIASEFNFQFDMDSPVYELYQYSDEAAARREKRIEAAKNNMIYHG